MSCVTYTREAVPSSHTNSPGLLVLQIHTEISEFTCQICKEMVCIFGIYKGQHSQIIHTTYLTEISVF